MSPVAARNRGFNELGCFIFAPIKMREHAAWFPTAWREANANFLRRIQVALVRLLPSGFRLTVGEPFGAYWLYSSTDLTDWGGLGIVSNSAVIIPFTDGTDTNARRKIYRAAV
jgi:hypothetical protein